MKIPRLLLAGTNSGVGKTSITCSIIYGLKKMGYFGMAWFLLKNFYNRNNKAYWNTVDHSRYW